MVKMMGWKSCHAMVTSGNGPWYARILGDAPDETQNVSDVHQDRASLSGQLEPRNSKKGVDPWGSPLHSSAKLAAW